jgi:antitoxin (DNA-binding transcriptional repressor) of toxin-antitoxin stability system
LARLERGEDIVIARAGVPVARLVPIGPLVAQATLEDATLVTVDSAIVGLPLLRVLSW